MSLGRALSWSLPHATLRMAAGFVSAKVTAVYVGPAGVALLGQVSSFMQVTAGAIGNGAHTAVVTMTAERGHDRASLRELWASAMTLVAPITVVALLAIVLLSAPLSDWLLFSSVYRPVILAAGLAITLVVADNIVTGAINGLRQLNVLASTGILATAAEVAVFTSLTYKFGLWGALFGISAMCAVRLSISCAVAFRSGLLRPQEFVGRFNTSTVRGIATFYPMLFAQSVSVPLAQIVLRNLTVGSVGLEDAGYLQATWRLSDVYGGVLTTALGLYFMAHFSSLKTEEERGALLRRTVLQIGAVAGFAAVAIYIFREFIVSVVLTIAFLPMTALLPFQLAGDVFKFATYPMQMALVSTRRTSAYILQAIGGQALYVALTYLWLPSRGLQAAPQAYTVTHAFLLILLGLTWRSTLSAPPAMVGADPQRVAS